jgi:hypothetical protein
MARALVSLIVAGMVAAFLWAHWHGYEGLVPGPTVWSDRFSDLTEFYVPIRTHDPYLNSSAYPPFAFLLIEPFSWIGGAGAVVVFAAVLILGIGAFLWWELDLLAPIDRATAAIVLTIGTYPFLFGLHRANIEVYVTLLLAAFVWALQTGRGELAAVAIGTAAAIKGYPVIFGGLFLAWRQWRLLAIAGAIAIGLSVIAAVYYYGWHLGRVFSLMRAGGDQYTEVYAIGSAGVPYGCSLLGPVRVVVLGMFGGSLDAMRAVLPVYTAAAAVLALCVVLVLWRLPLAFWEQITLLVLALNLLPTVSADYKLFHLVVPIALFLRYGSDDRWRWWYLVGFAALLVPKVYIVGENGVGPGTVLDPLIMVAIGTLIIVSGLQRRTLGRGSPVGVAT